MSHDIFISYSRRDTERMQQVRDFLRESGLKVWTDEGIEPGTESWKTSISDAITGCTCVVVLFSPDAAQSTWVNRELDFAELHHKKIYPLLVQGKVEDSLPFGYTTFQFIDIRSNNENLPRLIATLQGDFPNRYFAASVHPQAVDPTQTEPEDAYRAVESTEAAQEKEETLWKRIETSQLRLFVPSTWKISEPTHENWARAMLLMTSKDENALYQVLKDENRLASLWTGIPGAQSERHIVISDISGFVPLAGLVTLIKLPLPVNPLLMKIIIGGILKRIGAYWKQVLNVEISDTSWLNVSSGKIFVVTSGNPSLRLRAFLLIPSFGTTIFSILVAADVSRFEQEQADYEHMAQSAQRIYG